MSEEDDDVMGGKVTEPARLDPGGAGKAEGETEDSGGFGTAAAKEHAHMQE